MTNKKTQIVIGLGEVGSAIQKILGCDGYDFKNAPMWSHPYDVIHICIPWSDSFVASVINYQKLTSADLVIVHSSVPVGTCDPHGWVHSPVRGVHPELERGIRTFVKYFGGARAEEAACYFSECLILTQVTDKAANTEAAKLWDTTQYGVMILLEKEIHKFCQEHDLDFSLVYESFNESYNSGYRVLGRLEVFRPHLRHMDGKIGGHCVVPNALLLESPSAKRIVEENERL